MVGERLVEKKVVEKHVKEYVYRSKLPDIEIPYHLLLHTYCFQNIDSYRHKPCIINGGTGDIYTYGEVELATRRVAAGLHRLGIKRGEVIMILLPNLPEFVFSFLGASYSGAISTTANPLYTPLEIAKQANSAGVRLVITMACYVEKVRDMAAERGVKVVTIDKPAPPGCFHFSDLAGVDELPPVVEISPDDLVTLPFSSGTTGLPKGVLLTHKGQVANIAQVVDGDNPNLHYRRDDVLLCVLPMYHIYCLSSVLLGGMRAGAALVVMQRFEIRAMMELVQKHRVTVAPIVPPIVLAIAKSPLVDEFDLSSIRAVICGAAPMGRELEDALRAKLPNIQLGQGYGMTESGAISMCLAFAKEPYEIKSGSCGTVVRNSELKIIDPNTRASLRRNESGEICVRGPQIMKGYLNNSEATQNIIDEEGWLHTGDIGYVDDDEELFIVDRLKEIIKYKGYQVAPAELEAMLMAHPKLVDAAVVPMKDEVAGEVPVAFVVKSNDSYVVTEDEIKQFISIQVVFYKRINRVFFVDSIPKAPSGKILRKELREMLANGFPK